MDIAGVLMDWRSTMQILDYPPVLDRIALLLQAHMCSPGVLLDSSLFLGSQVVVMAWELSPSIGWCTEHCLFLNQASLTRVVHAIVTPRLDDCSALCVGLLLKTVQKLQLAQNAMAQGIMGAQQFDSVRP